MLKVNNFWILISDDADAHSNEVNNASRLTFLLKSLLECVNKLIKKHVDKLYSLPYSYKSLSNWQVARSYLTLILHHIQGRITNAEENQAKYKEEDAVLNEADVNM